MIQMTYITYYGTNILEIPAGVIGLLLMASKIFDAFTDLIAGVLVDRTSTRWGKARPYEFSIIGIWLCTVLMFACPDFGMIGRCAWIFIWYSLTNAVFFTLLNADEPVYMMRAIPNRQDMEQTASLNGLFSLIGSMMISIIYPLLMVNLGTSKEGWTVMALIFAIPMGLIGLLRVLLIPEVKDHENTKKEKVSAQAIRAALCSNRYIYLYILLIIAVNLISGFSQANTYYFTYIVKDQTMMSVASLPSMITPFLLLFFPVLLKKHSVIQISKICIIIGIAGTLIKQFAGADMTMILSGTFISMIGFLPLSAFSVILLTDIVDYNEWKTKNRVEGVYASFGSFGQKLGQALSSVVIGFLLQISGFVSNNSAVQPDSALTMIQAMFGIIQGIILVLILVVLVFFNLDKKMPLVRKELADQRNEAAGRQ